MNFSKGLRVILFAVLFVLSSAVVSHSQDFISILKTDWIIMKNLLTMQERQMNSLNETYKLQLIEIENLKVLSSQLQNQLHESTIALEKSQLSLQNLNESIASYEKLLTSTNKKAELQRILLIVIPIALLVLAIGGFGAGIYIGFKYL